MPIAAVKRWKQRSVQRRLLFWPVILTALCGVIDLGMPLERVVQTARDTFRSRPADRKTIVIRLDDRSVRSLPWSRRGFVNAELVEKAFALGARRIVFDQAFTDPSPAGDDALFAQALERHHGRVIVGTRFEDDPTTLKRTFLLPVPVIRRVATLGSYNVRRDALGYTTGVPYASLIAGRKYPSFAALLAGRTGNVDELFEPDFAIGWHSVPFVSATDVFNGRLSERAFAGKDVIVGPTADSLGDTHIVPGQGPLPGVYIHALAAETLRRATPHNAGWTPCYALALAASVAFVRVRTRRRRLATLVSATAAIALVPLVLDTWNIDLAIVPAALLLVTVAIRTLLMERRMIHPTSDLPTLDAMLDRAEPSPVTLIGLRLANYADVHLSLSGGAERLLFAEVARRLAVAGHMTDLNHVDDTLVCSSDLEVSRTLTDHLDGLHAILAAPFDVAGRRIDLSFTFGIDGDADRPLAQRVRAVQFSAEDAAARGRRWQVSGAGIVDDADFRLSLPSRIEDAIASGHLWVAYQPKMALDPKRVASAEALVRWSDPERGSIRPDEFIPIIEKANRIDRLTYFVLDTAIRDAARLDGVAPGFAVAVNLSVSMLNSAELVENVLALLSRHGLPASRLTLEITETLPIGEDSSALATLRRLRAAGIDISIDDYGTKFSNLENVRHLPATEIKIDRQFAEKVGVNAEDAIVVGSTIRLAHDLQLKVVAEGVEEPSAYLKLKELGCDMVQGYLIAKPMPIGQLAAFLKMANPDASRDGYRLANYA